MIQLLFLSGSTRQQSFNKQLAQLAVNYARQDKEVEPVFVDLNDYPMPLYNGDDEASNGLPDNAIWLKKIFSESHGFFIASPEYNSSISALLKNTLDWISRSHLNDEPPLTAFKDKVAAISSVSPGELGGLRGLVSLRMMLGNIGVHVIPAQVAIGSAFQAFDEHQNLSNAAQKDRFETMMQQFLSIAKHHAKLQQ